jgi:predicted MarR family transcription regulator
MALMLTLSLFTHLVNGFRNQDLQRAVVKLLGTTAGTYTAQQATYDLRRLCRKGLLHRRRGTHRYVVTPYGWKVARLYARLEARVFRPALTAIEGQSVADPTPKLSKALAKVDHEMDTLIASALPQKEKAEAA